MKKSEVRTGSIVSVSVGKGRNRHRTTGRILRWSDVNKDEVIVASVVTGEQHRRSPRALWLIVK